MLRVTLHCYSPLPATPGALLSAMASAIASTQWVFLPEFVHARFQVASVTSHQPAVSVHRRRLGRGGHGANRIA
ncbi:exported hypothetical protein [Xanthomonas citri pv. fuscans]|nr:exported hypothetical protein [Xanthomonas citri pv. fuscans]SON99595.1 exported hypothetical protein [Xanthomonas citri pv. fuscans]SOO05800.1 exported hypothetical protein [Xanthomonas citri pv. fuscans]SOO07289.1 exported hypothetical protein [Xanthomonas citri pv. fuscans]SOO13582.1 exported hypothetical protein [Xanthomonas citri pv. fuscans]